MAKNLSAMQAYVVQVALIRNSEMFVWVALVKTRTEEKILKSAWHAMIALVGLYELRNQKTKVSKVLSCGLIAFHVDAAVCDALDQPTTLQRLLGRLKS